ncbi:class I SAM-dependent methyltransferase [Nocardia nepalensis]|uniref:class I SAM-dependent methyltransferase n=1 Tax=Nocardia nepalensis TaxID=3375448 RepID=UPI003B67944B
MTAIPPHLHPGHPGDGHEPHGPVEWDDLYDRGPEWDIGRAQSAFRELADNGALTGRVLDLGCGTGEHVLMCAEHGLAATGIDISPAAINLAMHKAFDRGLRAEFRCHDATLLAELGEQYDTVLDCGLFVHLIDDDTARTAYLDGLRSTTRVGGRYFLLCFREGGDHHRALTLDEIAALFADGWRVDSIDPTVLRAGPHAHEIPAWLAAFTRVRTP